MSNYEVSFIILSLFIQSKESTLKKYKKRIKILIIVGILFDTGISTIEAINQKSKQIVGV